MTFLAPEVLPLFSLKLLGFGFLKTSVDGGFDEFCEFLLNIESKGEHFLVRVLQFSTQIGILCFKSF